jgi:hypothetical protein
MWVEPIVLGIKEGCIPIVAAFNDTQGLIDKEILTKTRHDRSPLIAKNLTLTPNFLTPNFLTPNFSPYNFSSTHHFQNQASEHR